MTRIAIADDHGVVRKGLRQIISEGNGLEVAGEAASADELLTLLRTKPVDAVVLDLSLGTRDGIEVLKHIKSEFPRTPVLILSMHAESVFAIRALRAGAAGYVQKETAPETLLEAISRIAAGGVYVSSDMAARLALQAAEGHRSSLPHERLSDREFEIFRLLGSGRSVTQIAHALNLSVKTVSTHRARILEKTLLRTNAEIVDYVTSHGLR